MEDRTYDLELLERSRLKWRSSRALRAFYGNLYRTMVEHCISGPTLEVGSGIGVSKLFIPNIMTSDIVKTKYVDISASCYDLKNDMQWANILALDVFHHLRYPIRFLTSASGALRVGGRLILIEPAATCAGSLLYRLFHHEPMCVEEVKPPYDFENAKGDENFSNMAMAEGIFGKQTEKTQIILRNLALRLIDVKYRDLFVYFCTGGFSHRSLLPAAVVKRLLELEGLVPQYILKKMALRMLIVIERI